MLRTFTQVNSAVYRHCTTMAMQLIKGIKVKVTLVQALRLCTGRTAHRGSRDIALLFHDHSTRRGCGVRVTPRPLFTPAKDTVPIVQEAGWDPGPVWTGGENLAIIGIRSPDRPVRSQSLYRLSYPAHMQLIRSLIIQRVVSLKLSSVNTYTQKHLDIQVRVETKK